MKTIRIMLVDDHTVVRGGIKLLIDSQADMEVVAEAATAREVIPQATRAQPDVVVLDLTLPDGGGLPLIRELLQLPKSPRILILTMHDDPAYVRSSLGQGASGYVVKTISEQALLAAIRSVSEGRLIVDLDGENRTASVFLTDAAGRPVPEAVSASKLSERETEVLTLLGRGFTNQAVAEQLDLSPKTVATYRARIGEKLGLKSTADFVKYAADTGLLARPENPA